MLEFRKKERNIGLDLLRIISMLMILSLHYLGKGQALTIDSNMKYIVWFIEIACMVAVNLYVLSSGYFLLKGNFKWKKVFSICKQTWFYSLLFLMLALLFKGNLSIKEWLIGLFPIILKVYWFVTIYLFMYIMSPYLNILIHNMTKKQHFNLCFILIGIFSILHLFLPPMATLNPQGGSGIIWFLTLYLIAGYIKNYVNIKKNGRMLIIYFVITIFLVMSKLVLESIFVNIPATYSYISRIYDYYSIFILIGSLCLFLYFKDIKINNVKVTSFVTMIAPLTFGVYLIHENVFVAQALYRGLFNSFIWASKGLIFIIVYILTIITIFIVCSVMEYVRIRLFQYFEQTKIGKKIKMLIKYISSDMKTRFSTLLIGIFR